MRSLNGEVSHSIFQEKLIQLMSHVCFTNGDGQVPGVAAVLLLLPEFNDLIVCGCQTPPLSPKSIEAGGVEGWKK